MPHPDTNIPTLAELLDERVLYTPTGNFLNCMVDLAVGAHSIVEKIEKVKHTIEPDEIAKLAFLNGVEQATKILLQYMSGELHRTETGNVIDPCTSARPSENKLVNAGSAALAVAITYHNAAHYSMMMLGKKGDEILDYDFEKAKTAISEQCHVVSKVLDIIHETLPESLPAPLVK